MAYAKVCNIYVFILYKGSIIFYRLLCISLSIIHTFNIAIMPRTETARKHCMKEQTK